MAGLKRIILIDTHLPGVVELKLAAFGVLRKFLEGEFQGLSERSMYERFEHLGHVEQQAMGGDTRSLRQLT